LLQEEGSEGEEGDEGEDEEEGEEQTEVKVKQNSFATTTAHKGTQMKLEGLKLSEIGILECSMLRMVVACLRCKYQVELSLTPTTSYGVECSGCHQAHIVVFRPGN
jgi:hypothetical protein